MTKVAVSMRIKSIMDINEVGGFFQVQFYLTMKWFESRLKFQNLKDDINLNSFLPSEITQIWSPELIFENTENKPATIADERTTIKVEKGGNFKLNKRDENENIQYYAGSENQIRMSRFYNQRFTCDYQMGWYPFDVQKCKMDLSIKKGFAPFTKLLADQLRYDGPPALTKYDIQETKIEVVKLEDVEAIRVTITLGRKLLGVLLNVFVPTAILNLISFSTNFYKDAYFESVIAINLTSMLVLVALFVQVNEGLPATAYIKMIDIWLIFNLVVPFILIVIHTYMDTLRPEEGHEDTPQSPEFKTESNTEATTEFTKQPTVRSPPRPPTSILYSLTPSTKVSVMTSRQKRNMRICFPL